MRFSSGEERILKTKKNTSIALFFLVFLSAPVLSGYKDNPLANKYFGVNEKGLNSFESCGVLEKKLTKHKKYNSWLIGNCYFNADNRPKSLEISSYYFKEAFEKNKSDYFANYYGVVEAVYSSYKYSQVAGRKLLNDYALKGSQSAAFNLGIIYCFGFNVLPSRLEARKYLDQSTRLGSKRAAKIDVDIDCLGGEK